MRGKIMAIDFGMRRVGIAVSDPLRLLAHSRETFCYKSQQALLEHLCAMVTAEEITEIVVGWPRRLDGSAGEMAERVRRFSTQLSEKVAVPVVYWDERLTSQQAKRELMASGMPFSHRKGEVDKLAAVFILQSYLDSLSARRLPQQEPRAEHRFEENS